MSTPSSPKYLGIGQQNYQTSVNPIDNVFADPMTTTNPTNTTFGTATPKAPVGNTTTPPKNTNTDGAFAGKNIGSTMQGIGAISTALANVYATKQQQKYQNKVLDMEKARVADEKKQRDKQQSAYDSVWG